MEKSLFRNYLIWTRYLIYRYLLLFRYKNYFIKKGLKLKTVDSSGISFFGYYNISPTNSKDELLFLKVNNKEPRGSILEPARIMLRDAQGVIIEIAQSNSWNWQQGCMLQWLPKDDEFIIFNDYEKESEKYISKIINKKGQAVKSFNIPIYNISKSGDFALSLNFNRLATMRPDYGYFNRLNDKLLDEANDGIWHLDLINGKTCLVLTLRQLADFSPTESMLLANHKVNHIDINPSGTRFLFLHRWIGPKGRFMRLITANPDGSDIRILIGDKMISHCCWIDDYNILAFCYIEGFGVGYYKIDERTKTNSLYSTKLPEVDGHPSFSPDGKFLITDTYPDLSRMSCLYLYNLENDNCQKIGHFFQPLKYKKEIRIDLHPKWSYSGNNVFFESGHKNVRSLYELSLLDV